MSDTLTNYIVSEGIEGHIGTVVVGDIGGTPRA